MWFDVLLVNGGFINLLMVIFDGVFVFDDEGLIFIDFLGNFYFGL